MPVIKGNYNFFCFFCVETISDKTIKIFFKILLVFLLVIIILPTSSFFVLKSKRVQTYLTQNFFENYLQKLDGNFNIEKVEFKFFNRLVLTKPYFEDQYGDTLLYADEATAYLKLFNRNDKELKLRKVEFDRAKFNLFQDTNEVNLKFITERLKNNDTVQSGFVFEISEIVLNNSVFRLRTYKKPNPNSEIDFTNMFLQNLDIHIRDFIIQNKTIDFEIRNLSFVEKSGFEVLDLQTHMHIATGYLGFYDIKIRSPYSYILADSLSFSQKDFEQFKDFFDNVNIESYLNNSNLSFIDLAFFNKKVNMIKENLILTGTVYGTVNSLKGKDVTIQFGQISEVVCDFDFNGLPDTEETYVYFNIQRLTSHIDELKLINDFQGKRDTLLVPENFRNLGQIIFKGKFAGFFDDFVTYGKFQTDLGTLFTDLSLSPIGKRGLSFDGEVKTSDFEIGQLASIKENVGKLNMDITITGKRTLDSGLVAQTEGNINSIIIQEYNYQNISLDGMLTTRTYNGILNIDDPNIEFLFSGGVDFSKDTPIFDFNLEVPRANLHGLNIDKNDSSSLLSFDMKANIKGSGIDYALGEVFVTDLSLRKMNENLNLDTIYIVSNPMQDTNYMNLKSELIDAELSGRYKSSTIIQSMKNLFYNYLPALAEQTGDTAAVDCVNNFRVAVHLKKTRQLSRFFYPVIILGDQSEIQFQYNNKANDFKLLADLPLLNIRDNVFNEFELQAFTTENDFIIESKSKSFLLNNYWTLENFTTLSTLSDNYSDLNIDWMNNDTVDYIGDIQINAMAGKNPDTKNQKIEINIEESKIVVADSIWEIGKSRIVIDTTTINVEEFMVTHNNQNLTVDGILSESEDDNLNVEFEDIQLDHMNILTNNKKLIFRGIINGTASLSDPYEHPVFFSNLKVTDFMFNEVEMGAVTIFTEWNEEIEAIDLAAVSALGKLKMIDIAGKYFPDNGEIDLDINLDKLKVGVLSPIMANLFSDVKGLASGSAHLSGPLKRPFLNGDLLLQKSGFKVNYLQTLYNFTAPLEIENNLLIFKDIDAYDIDNNIAKINGTFYIGREKSINYDFTIDADNILALNTTGIDNERFYGKAYMSGIVNINGDGDNTLLDISAVTEQETRIFIPLETNESIRNIDFVKFVGEEENTSSDEENIYRPAFSGITLNFDLEITPDAESQLIFDSKIGDIIKARGEGNVKLEIDRSGDFNMYGDYIIEDGDYLFTLQNVINKKFEIERGGRILWNGAPEDANIDIEASYNLKTSLSGLLVDTSDYYKKRIPVKCEIFLTENLANPNIKFDIELPTADEDTKTRVRNVLNTQEKLNKQFLSLLVINNFIAEQDFLSANSSNPYAGLGDYSGIGTVTTSELLSNQLSHWLSQISDEWDIGVNYRPGDEISKDQVEVALSTQLLNDRISINGNFGVGGYDETQTSNIVGDFNVDVKLNKSGKLRAKVYNETNDKRIYEESPYTQGIGLFYREEFNNFGELFDKIYRGIFKRKKKDKNNNQETK